MVLFYTLGNSCNFLCALFNSVYRVRCCKNPEQSQIIQLKRSSCWRWHISTQSPMSRTILNWHVIVLEDCSQELFLSSAFEKNFCSPMGNCNSIHTRIYHMYIKLSWMQSIFMSYLMVCKILCTLKKQWVKVDLISRGSGTWGFLSQVERFFFFSISGFCLHVDNHRFLCGSWNTCYGKHVIVRE